MSYVYAMTNQMFKDHGVFRMFKIGMTTTDPFTRARELYTTGVPHPFRVIWYHQCVDPKWYEEQLHTIFKDKRYNRKREFFYLPYEGIKEHLDGLAEELDNKFENYEWNRELDRFDSPFFAGA